MEAGGAICTEHMDALNIKQFLHCTNQYYFRTKLPMPPSANCLNLPNVSANWSDSGLQIGTSKHLLRAEGSFFQLVRRSLVGTRTFIVTTGTVPTTTYLGSSR